MNPKQRFPTPPEKQIQGPLNGRQLSPCSGGPRQQEPDEAGESPF